MSEPRVTLCILAAPDEAGLAECLAGSRGAVDHVLVGCTGSPEAAAALAGELGVQVVPVAWAGSFAAARNQLLDGADGDWVLMLDADERLELAGTDRLRELASAAGAPGLLLPVRSPVGPAQGGEPCLSYQVRLFRNRPDYRYDGIIGEQLPQKLLGAAVNQPAPDGILIHHQGFAAGEALRRSLRNLEAVGSGSAGEWRKPPVALARGMQLLRQGRLAGACDSFAAADGAEGATAASLIRWQAYALLRLGRIDEALAILEDGCLHHPRFTDLWLLQGEALAAAGRKAEAIQSLRRCLDLGPPPPPYETTVGAGDALPLLKLGALEEQAGRLDATAERYTEAYRARPERSESLHQLARVMGAQGRAKQMAASLRDLVGPTTSEQWLLLADVLSVQRQYRAALRCADSAARLGANPADVAMMRGFCHLKLGGAAAAEAALVTVPADYELATTVLHLRLLAAWCRQDCPGARLLLTQLEQSPLPSGAQSAAQGLHLTLCRSDEPLVSGPAWGEAGGQFLLEAVDVLLGAGQRQAAERAAALMDRCGWPGGYEPLALLFRLRGKHGLARQYVGKAMLAKGEGPALLCNLAELELRERHWPEALGLAARASELDPGDPLPYLLKAQIFRAQAIDLLRMAKKRWDDPELAQLLAELTGGAGR